MKSAKRSPYPLLATTVWLFATLPLSAQADPGNSVSSTGVLGGMSALEQLLFALCIVVLIGGATAIVRLSFVLMELQKIRLLRQYAPETLEEVGISVVEPRESWWSRMYKKWTDTVPIEREADIMLDHEYDGVRELDNNLPPWWVATFYLTAIFSVGYIYVMHFTDWGISSAEEYVRQIEIAEAEVDAYLAGQANAIDETNVTLLGAADAIGSGQLLYKAKCAVCHGQVGEGGIGPNLTDDYWIHGGSINDVFKTIKYGVPEKGMVPWKNELLPRQMQEVASFIKGLRGTDPPNAKEPQGDLYAEETQAGEESASR